jgi:Tfp pilus assembly protein PilN
LNIAELLSVDMKTVMRWLRSGFHWWLDEMAAMLPAMFDPRRKRLVEYSRYEADGTIDAARGKAGATIIIPKNYCHFRHLQMPRMSSTDIRSMVELDIERIMPLTADSIVFDLIIGKPDADGKMLPVDIAALPLSLARDVAATADQLGLTLRRVGSMDADEHHLEFDFAPAMRAAGILPSRPNAAGRWWTAVALLVLCNIGTLVLRDQQRVNQLEELAAAQSIGLNAVKRVENRLRENANLLKSLEHRRESQQPARLLSTLGKTLPAQAWIERLSWEGGELRLSGYAAKEVDVVAAFKAAPGLTRVRASQAETMADTRAGKPFDITAQIKATAR